MSSRSLDRMDYVTVGSRVSQIQVFEVENRLVNSVQPARIPFNWGIGFGGGDQSRRHSGYLVAVDNTELIMRMNLSCDREMRLEQAKWHNAPFECDVLPAGINRLNRNRIRDNLCNVSTCL